VVAVSVAVVLAGAFGLALRAWLLRHSVLNSDEAVVGLMAHGVLAGHLATFYWGQHYGGAEPYVVAAVLWLAHGSPTAIGATSAALSALAAVLVAVIAATATGDRWFGAAAGAVAWVWPYAVVWNSLRETGFRGVCLACGLLALACALRIHRGGRGLATYLVMGLAAGVGWWASPEIAYFALPVAVVLVASWDRLYAGPERRAGPWHPAPAVTALAGVVVGALPWIYTNARTGFASLRAGSLPNYEGIGYGGRLEVFFRAMLPVQLGVRAVPGGAWVGGPVVGQILYGLVAAVVVVALVSAALAARRGRRSAPLVGVAAGVLTFPFVYALVPATGYWVDGRYGVLLPSLVVLALALALARTGPDAVSAPRKDPVRARHARRSGRSRPTRRVLTTLGPPAFAVACAGLLAAGVLTAATARAGGVPTAPAAFASGWGDPEAPARHVLEELHRHHIRYAYGSYWTAYVLDALDPDGVVVSPSHLDVVRWPAEAAAVRSARDPAWLFSAPGHLKGASLAFSNAETGPGNFTEQQFTGLLEARGVPYRVVHLGVLDAVVPDRRVTLPQP
jgi:hypothetical protein